MLSSSSPTIAKKTKSSPLLDTKIEETCAGFQPSFAKRLYSIGEDNAATVVDYIAAMKSEANLSDHYRRDLIDLLSKFSKYNDNKPFKDLTRANIIAFLESHRKTENQDPMHK